MAIEQLVDDILQQLYDNYIKSGTQRVDLNDYITSNGFTPSDVRKLMDDQGLIRSFQITTGFIAVITPRGIDRVNGNFFSDAASKVLDDARKNNGNTTVGRAISLPDDWGGMAKDIGKYLSDNGLANTQIERADVRVYVR